MPGKYNIAVFQTLQFLSYLQLVAALLVSVTYTVIISKLTSLINSSESDNFLRKAYLQWKQNKILFRHWSKVALLHLILFPLPSACPSLHSHPNFGDSEFLFIWKHIKCICFSLKRSGKPQALARGLYDSQVQACFQRIFFLIIKISAKFESYLCFHVNSCPTDMVCCLLNTFAVKIYNCVWSS